jgi:1-acyl-sn-glycerol-3-phosphate acyltransferase
LRIDGLRQAMVAKSFYKLFHYVLFRIRVRGVRRLAGDEPVIFVANHAGSFGPISVISALPFKLHPWVNHEVTELKSVARRIRDEFVERELHIRGPLSAFLSRAIGRICVALMRDIGAIPVYNMSKRIKSTVEASVQLLEQGKSLLVFPEDSLKPLNEAMCEFCTGFIHLAKLYYEKTRKAVCFLPVGVNRRLHSIKIGSPVRFDANAPFPVEKARLKKELESRIFSLYRSLEEEAGLAPASG